MNTAVLGYMPMPADFPHRALFLKGRPQHRKYDEFWRKHPPMDRVHRAKIFSAFDALAGFDDWVASKEIPYCDRRHLSDEEREDLNRTLSSLHRQICRGKAARCHGPQVSAQYFSPCTDPHSFAYGTGGTYKTVTGICRSVDAVSGTVTIGDQVLAMDDITAITAAQK